MENPALSLIPWQNQDEHRTVALRSNRQVAMFDMNLGPGRMLHQAYSVSGRWVEKGLGLTGHKLGMGPSAVSCRIKKAFGDDSLTKLDSIYDSFQNGTRVPRDRALIKECQKLLEYALPSQSPATQVETAKQIITLTTRYPGLRRLFLQSPDIGIVADSPDAIYEFWQNTNHNYDTESHFLLNFAANCLASIEPNIELEAIRPSELGCMSEKVPGVVDRLLARHCVSDERSRFPRLLAIRYIAATLEFPAFWSSNYQIQMITMDNLCKKALLFIEDINPEAVSADDFESILFDPDGIDALAEAILVGGKHWLQRQPQLSESSPPYWITSFVKLIKILRDLILPSLLPMAFQRAAEDWEALLRVVKHELPMSSLDQFEDVYAFATGCSGILPSLMKPSDVAEELRNGDAKGLSSLEANKTQDKDSSNSPSNTASRPVSNNVIVFGESGSGKSSLINMVIGQDVAKVSNGPWGTTFENECYETHIDGMPYLIYDTVGLNEGDEGRVPHWTAIQGLYTLIRKLDGVSLLIFCIRGRIKDNAHANWLFFFDAICDKKVPVVVVSTCWEQEENLEEAEAQLRDALKKYSMVPKAVACVVSIRGRNSEHGEKYKLSQQRLRYLFSTCRVAEPWSKDKDEWFAQLYQRVSSSKLWLFAKTRLQFVEGIRLPLQEFKENGNLEESDIDKLTKNLLQAEKRILKKRS